MNMEGFKRVLKTAMGLRWLAGYAYRTQVFECRDVEWNATIFKCHLLELKQITKIFDFSLKFTIRVHCLGQWLIISSSFKM